MSKIYINVDGVNIEATGQALQDILDFQAQCKSEADAKEAEAATKAAQRQALLTRLGITEDEARLLLG
jgi:hypothetical protein